MTDQHTRARTPSGPAEKGTRPEYVSAAGFFLRLFWMAFGNLLLLYLTASILRADAWSLTGRDAAYWFTVAALIFARHIDVTRHAGLTINSEPATKAHVRRYAIGLLLVVSLVWAGAQSIKI